MKRPFLALAFAQVFSVSGSRLAGIAVPWLVLTTTGDPVLTGLVALFEMLPYVIAKGFSGPWIDRLGARRIAVAGDSASALVMALVLLHAIGTLTLPVLLPIVFVIGMLRGPSDAAKGAMTPAVAELSGVPLERVAGVTSAIDRLASTVGLAASGALIALVGTAEVLILNAVAFGIAATIIGFGIPSLAPVPRLEAKPTTYWQDLREGWNFLRRDNVLVALVLMVSITNLLDQAFASVLVPVWVRQHGFGPELLGMLFATFAGASVAGASIAAAVAERLPRLLVYSGAFILTSMPFLAFATAPLPGIFTVQVISGFAAGFINPIIGVVMMERIPRAMMGRVTSLIGALAWSLLPFGGLIGGVVVAGFGGTFAMWIVGIAYFTATLIPLANPSFRRMNRIPA